MTKSSAPKEKRVKERQSLRQRHMLDHIDDYEVASDQWWDKDNPRGKGNDVGSSPQRLHHRQAKHNFEEGRETSDGEELQGGGSDSEKDEASRPNSSAEGKKETESEQESKPAKAEEKDSAKDAGAQKKDDDAGSSSDEDEAGKQVVGAESESKKSIASSQIEEKGSVYKVTFLNPTQGRLGLALAESTNVNRPGVYVKETSPDSVSGIQNWISAGHKLMSISLEGDDPVDVSKSKKTEAMDVLKKLKGSAGKKSLVLQFMDLEGKLTSEISIDTAKGKASKPITKDEVKKMKKKKNIFGF